MKPKLLIFGGSGLLGLNWAIVRKELNDTWITYRQHELKGKWFKSLYCNAADENQTIKVVKQVRPQIIVNAVALTNVENCEKNPSLAEEINTTAAKNIAYAAHLYDAKLIHISTDHLFSGQNAFSKEFDIAKPLNEYAKTKLMAENVVLDKCPRSLVIRTNFFGWGTSYCPPHH